MGKILFFLGICILLSCNPTLNRSQSDILTRYKLIMQIIYPSSISYSNSAITFYKGIDSKIEATKNGIVLNCTIFPDLPLGLSLDSKSCGISGIPLAVQTMTRYKITSTNEFSSSNTFITIIIEAGSSETITVSTGSAPSNLNYPNSIYLFKKNSDIGTILPSITGSISSCVASPSLPNGLLLNSTNCALSGIPITATVMTDYVVTASNSFGSVSVTIKIQIQFDKANAMYVANYAGNITVFSVNSSNGTLTLGTPVASGTNPRSVAVDPTGKYLYCVAYGSNQIRLHPIDQATGGLAAGTSIQSTGSQPNSVVVHPTGRYVYVANNSGTISVFNASLTDGTLSLNSTTTTGTGARTIGIEPKGKFLYTSNASSNSISSFSIDLSTGTLTEIGTAITVQNDPRFFAIDPRSKFLYVANYNSNTFSQFTIDSSTGVLSGGSVILSTGLNSAGAAETIMVHPLGGFLLGAMGVLDMVRPFIINSTTGILTPGNGTASTATVSPSKLIIDPSGSFVYTSSWSSPNISLFSINQSSGEVTFITSYAHGQMNPNAFAITGIN